MEGIGNNPVHNLLEQHHKWEAFRFFGWQQRNHGLCKTHSLPPLNIRSWPLTISSPTLTTFFWLFYIQKYIKMYCKVMVPKAHMPKNPT